MKIMLVLFCLLTTQGINAQTETIKVKAGEDISQVLSEYGKYRFTAFREGRLFYNYGKNAIARFNYNYRSAEMQYIDARTGDTLDIANPEQVILVKFDSTTFYYNEGFMELVADYDSVKLAKKQRIKIEFEKTGAYGQSNPTSAIDNRRQYIDRNRVVELSVNQDATIRKQTSWYLITKEKERPIKADRAGFEKLFPQHASAIKSFLQTEKDVFKNPQKIMQLLVICLQ